MIKLALGLLAACVVVFACGTGADAAEDLRRRSIPAGDRASNLSQLERQPNALRYEWTVETHLNPREYVNFLKSQLKEFEVTSDSGTQLRLATARGGDAYRLSCVIEEVAGGGYRVRVQVTQSPD